jgi:hypothetical protein
MKISTRYTNLAANIIIESDNIRISEDLAEFKRDKEGNCKWKVPETIIEQLITAARDFSLFNDQDDADFIKKICDAFLNDFEREELIEYLSNPK